MKAQNNKIETAGWGALLSLMCDQTKESMRTLTIGRSIFKGISSYLAWPIPREHPLYQQGIAKPILVACSTW
jgi:hypothetical protein